MEIIEKGKLPETSFAIIDANDVGIDWTTDDGKEEMSALAYALHRRRPTLTHFLFEHKGRRVGEMIIMPDHDSSQWN